MISEKKIDKNEKKITVDEMINEYKKIMKKLQIQNKMGKLLQTHQIRTLRKEIARLLTKNKENNNKK